MSEKTILVLFGGCSVEYEVSLASGREVLAAMAETRYRPLPVGITREGRWLYCPEALDRLSGGSWQDGGCVPCTLDVSRGSRSLLLLDGGGERIRIDAAFPVLHGKNGEDGTVQGLLELAGIPVVGCGALSSALCMDKKRSLLLVGGAGIRVPKSVWFTPADSRRAVHDAAEEIGYPVFVKPVRGGSSLGVSMVREEEALDAAVEEAFRHDGEITVEETISGREVGCAVLGSGELLAGEVDEIEVRGGFFDYGEKYSLKNSFIHCPARIPPSQAEAVKEAAKKIYRLLACQGFARVDMFLTEEGEPVFIECNTIPGLTVHSQYPRMMAAAGLEFPQVVERLVEMALEARQ